MLRLRIPRALRKGAKIAGGIAALFLLCCLIDQLWCLRRMEGDVFLRQAEKITATSSFEDTSYIGCTGTAAYLSFWRVGRWRNIVY